ncbi:hypothetical protein LDENG_00200620 [Lucifuga dentata]|nr:hypothetical protein LDENG_00200620 [Lucifuga dentata]
MSLSPVIGTDVPETANGMVMPISAENGPHAPVPVKHGGSRVPCLGEGSEDGSFENHVDMESRVFDGQGRLAEETDNDETTSDLLLHAPHMLDASLPFATCTGESASGDSDIPDASTTAEPPGAAQPEDSRHTDSAQRGGPASTYRHQTETVGAANDREEDGDGEKEKQDEEDDEKELRKECAGGRTEVESLQRYSSSAPGPTTSSSSSSSLPPPLLPSDDTTCPPHVMAQVWVRNVPEKDRIVRGMQDSKSLDEISHACGGGSGARGGGRSGQSEGRRATISSALELEGTVSHDGDLTHFITKNLEQKIKMSSKPSLDCSDCECEADAARVCSDQSNIPFFYCSFCLGVESGL